MPLIQGQYVTGLRWSIFDFYLHFNGSSSDKLPLNIQHVPLPNLSNLSRNQLNCNDFALAMRAVTWTFFQNLYTSKFGLSMSSKKTECKSFQSIQNSNSFRKVEVDSIEVCLFEI